MTKERRHRLLVGLVGMIALVVGSVMVVIFLNWSKYLIGPHQDPFTELYFEDHLKLPRKIEIGVPFKTTFTIVNQEAAGVTYPIKVYTINEAQPPNMIELYTTSVSLSIGAAKTFPLELTIPTYTTPRQKIVIELLEKNQTIHFWVTTSTASTTF